ncbi:MAG: bifunctional (p)ppGpp synthetase/guanosine-3',5'-bis(diphosphate) 3'-pyrophosphohydrolase, partial [Sandaracinaceae bacterium]|nr:bifunctional (p)ppGpp synthetase/guanosine-3',5'-bis(diphosphate) 3'-pyrophosphohydrolase [Sandaracinaceae bacterium]
MTDLREPSIPPEPPVRESPDRAVEAVVAQLAQHHPGVDASVVRRAFELLQRDHADDGDAYAVGDAIDTASVLAGLRLDPPAVAAALVARVAMDEHLDDEAITAALGAEVAQLIAGVRRLAVIQWDRIEEEAAETLRKMFLAMAQDIRVVMVVLAMRVQGMRSLRGGALGEEARRRYAQETLDVFAPLANRLGIWQLKWELEDYALRELEPDAFAEITRLLAERRAERQAFIDEVVATLAAKLAEDGVSATVKGRPKHIYSIYKKMHRKGLDFEQLYDTSAVRVITHRLQDCYAVLGLVHSTWVPIPSEFDDYVAKPKDNGYQSLHTAVIGPRGRPVEVQIRTEEMHQLSEFGVAAHWAYKEGGGGHAVSKDKFMLLRQLMDWERDVSDPHQFVESLKTDIFEDQVYVFTPSGDVVDLPVGATPLDFAYRIHTMVGHRCRGARVNEQIVTLDYQLATGDRVEILTQKKAQPSRDWMNPNLGFLKTASARGKVRGWYRKQGREAAVHSGRELVEREHSRLDLEHTTIEDIATALKYASVADLYAAVGYGDRSPQSISSAGLVLERERAPLPEPPRPSTIPPAAKKPRPARGLRIGDVEEVMGGRARCCNPVPGDDVVGFVTRGRGITIHQRSCRHIVSTNERERLVEIDWGSDEAETHEVEIEIQAHDRAGLIGELTRLITAIGVNIHSARADS